MRCLVAARVPNSIQPQQHRRSAYASPRRWDVFETVANHRAALQRPEQRSAPRVRQAGKLHGANLAPTMQSMLLSGAQASWAAARGGTTRSLQRPSAPSTPTPALVFTARAKGSSFMHNFYALTFSPLGLFRYSRRIDLSSAGWIKPRLGGHAHPAQAT